MNVVVALEGRFRLNQGRPAHHHLTYERMWRRYVEVFDRVIVVGRLFPQEGRDTAPVEGPGVEFFPLPGYTGLQEFLLRATELRRRIRALCSERSAYILRVPGTIGTLVWRQLYRIGQPYALEVVGDPYDVLSPGSVRHPLRPLLRRWIPRLLVRQCREAMAAAYVTEAALQRRYPCPTHMFSYSDVVLPKQAVRAAPRVFRGRRGTIRLVMVGDVNQLYKAPHILIDAVARCVEEGLDLTLTFVGQGRYLEWLRQRADRRGIADRVRFLGWLPGGQAVWDALDTSDLFVLPSYQEGLPRAMLEAMGRGLPCVGSSVGGIGELLSVSDMVPAGDAGRLAEKIAEVATNPQRMQEMSDRNLLVARRYAAETSDERRKAFYRLVRTRTEAWLKA